MVSVVGSVPTGGNFMLCSNFSKKVNVNSGLKCKFDLIVKNSMRYNCISFYWAVWTTGVKVVHTSTWCAVSDQLSLQRLNLMKHLLWYLFAGPQEKQIIRNAFKSWMDNTCITFEEVDTNTDVTENHILLTAEGTGFVLQLNPVFPKCFSLNSLNSVTKTFFLKKIPVLEPTVSCVRNRDSTTVPQTHS